VAYEDQPLVTQLYVRANRITVLNDVVYNYRSRDDKSSISQQTASLKDLRERIAAWNASRDALLGVVPRSVYDAWLQTLFDAHFHWYLTSPGTSDDTYWSELRDAVVDLTQGASADLWDAILPDKRVLLELTLQGRRADAQEFVRLESGRLDRWEPVPREDGVLLRLPYCDDPDLDDRLFVIRPEQLRLGQSVERLQWLDDPDLTPGTCAISGWAYIRAVNLSQNDSRVSVVLHNDRTGEERAFESSERPQPAFPPPVENSWCDYEGGTYRVVVPVADVLQQGDPRDSWTVLLRVRSAGFTVTEPVTQVVRSGSAGVIPAALLPGGDRLVAVWRAHTPLRFERQPTPLEVTDVRLLGRTLTGVIGGAGAADVTSIEASTGALVATARVPGKGHRFRSFTVELPTVAELTAREPAQWDVTAHLGGHGPTGLALTENLDQTLTSDSGVLVVQRNRNGHLALGEWTVRAVAEALDVSPEGILRVSGTVLGPGVSTVALAARGKKSRTVGQPSPVQEGRFAAELPLTHDVYRFGAHPLPTGDHDFTVKVGTVDGRVHDAPLRMSSLLNNSLPVRIDTARLQGRVVRGPGGALRATVVRPLSGAGGPYHQRRLRTAEPSGRATLRGLLVRSYFGEHATDNGISIQKELTRRGSDLPVYWAVQDHSVPVPVGGTPVVVNSREWYELLGSVTYYLDNMYQPEYHQKPAGQLVIETFHGYPFKTMGHPHWRKLQLSKARIDSYDRRAAAWDYLVSPARYATPLLTEAFRYEGEVLEIGYPRNDVLLSAEADQIRQQTRVSLGVREGQTAVLYAPTFRDYLASGDSRAFMADFMDIRSATRALGEEYVVLVRGHAFNARSRHRVGDLPGVVDVTDYPEVSDLYLAADAAIVDYSSLRFDFGVTGKPMIFNVPDLQRYKDTRGWLFEFEPTAPGPLVSSTEAIVEQVRDLDGVRARHAAEYHAFRSTYLSLEDGLAGRRFVDAVFAPRGDA
jgi:CDP-glycerol glycerophosphotransferase